MEKIYITEDGERFEATGEQLEAILADRAAEQAIQEARKAAELAKAQAKAAILDKLGLTAEEAAALLS